MGIVVETQYRSGDYCGYGGSCGGRHECGYSGCGYGKMEDMRVGDTEVKAVDITVEIVVVIDEGVVDTDVDWFIECWI